MLHRMARGESGRVVIEIDPLMKRELYSALSLSGKTLKDWFIERASEFCSSTSQPSLFESTVAKTDQVSEKAEGR